MKDKNLLRICVQDADSLLWRAAEEEDCKAGLTRFLLALRSLLRTNIGICTLNVNMTSMSAEDLSDVAECCDYVIGLKAFDSKIRQA